MHEKPINVFIVFISMWIVTIACYLAHPVSSYLLTTRSLSFLFVIALLSIVAFYLPYRLFSSYLPPVNIGFCVPRLYVSPIMQFFCCANMIAIYFFILTYNHFHFGLAPFFEKLSNISSTYTYKSYGRGKNFLYYMPVIISLFFLYKGKFKASLAVLFFQAIVCILYLSRGPLIEALVFYFFAMLLVYRSRYNNWHIVLMIIFGLILTCALMGVLGDIRSGNENFKNNLGVDGLWLHVPVGLTWLVVYISDPFSNAVDFVANGYHEPLLNPNHHHWMNDHLANFRNTANSYLGNYFLHFSFFGLLFINFLYGSISGICYRLYQYQRSFLNLFFLVVCCVSSLFIFFYQMLFSYKMLIIIGLLLIFNYVFLSDNEALSVNKKNLSRG